MSDKVTGSGTPPMAQVYPAVQYREGSRKVTELHYGLPKGQHSNLVGSFSYTQPSAKAGRLKGQLSAQQRKLRDLEVRERATQKLQPRKKQILRGKIKYLQNELCREVASLSVTKVVVHELDND